MSTLQRSMLSAVAVALLFFLPGCLLSLKSIATKENTVTNDNLEGFWECKKTKDGWTIGRVGKTKKYRMSHRDPDGNVAVFEGHLVKIQDKLFLDMIATEEIAKDSNIYQRWTHVPMHLIIHVPSLDSELELSDVNPKWLKDYLKKNPKAIEHSIISDRMVLTDSPEKVQAFLSSMVGNEKAMTEARKYQKLLD